MEAPEYVPYQADESKENADSLYAKENSDLQHAKQPEETPLRLETTAYPDQAQTNQVQTNQLQTSQEGFISSILIAELPTNQVHSKVEISITDHFKKEDTLRDYTMYTIKGTDSQGYIEVTRRYNDFFLIRKTLVLKWPGCYVPAVPGKDVLKNMNPEFIAERKYALNLFLRQVADLPHLHYSAEYQVFLRNVSGPFEQAIKSYQKVQFDEMIQRYAVTFQQLALIQQTSEAPLISSRFRSFLYKISGRLRMLRATSKEIAKAKKKYYEGMAAFQAHVAFEYERDIIGEYQNFVNLKNVFSAPSNPQMEEAVGKMRGAINNSSVEYFDTWIAEEEIEVKTLLEAIDQREKYEGYKRTTYQRQKELSDDLRDLTTGQFNWKNTFSSRPKDQQIADLNQRIATCSREIEQLNTLIDMITLVISYIEIEKYKKSKSEKFYKIVGIAAQNELDNLSHATDYWNQVLSRNGVETL